MKTFFLLLLSLIGIQTNAQVMEDFRVMNQGTKPALTIIIPEVTPKYVNEVWKSYTKPYGKLASVKKADESAIMNAVIPSISTSGMNVYNHAESVGNDTKHIVWLELSGNFVSSANTPSEYTNAVRFLQSFKHEVLIRQASDVVDLETKKLKKLEDDLSKLEKQNRSQHKLISDTHKKIAKLESDISQNLIDQSEANRRVIEAETSLMEQKEKDKLANNVRKLENANTKMHKAIEDSHKRINKTESSIRQNLKDQEDMKQAIESQKVVLSNANIHLTTVRSNPPR